MSEWVTPFYQQPKLKYPRPTPPCSRVGTPVILYRESAIDRGHNKKSAEQRGERYAYAEA